MNVNDLQINFQKWNNAKEICFLIRKKVFIEEQSVPSELEWDTDDLNAIHVVLSLNKTAIGCARILTLETHVKLQRMAILKSYRLQGFGSFFLKGIINYTQENLSHKIIISAQERAINFYIKHGFEINSKTYKEAGISHLSMVLNINK